DAGTGQEVLPIKGHKGPVTGVAFSPDGTRVLTRSLDTAKVWNAAGGRELLSLKGDAVSGVAISPDGRHVLTAAALVEAAIQQGHVAISPDGRHVLTGGTDKTARVWDAETGREVVSLKGLTDRVSSIAFSPDGRQIVTAGGQIGRIGEAKLWD